MQQLLRVGVFVNMKSHSTGATPLHWAANNGDGVMAQLLIKHGADVHAKNFRGKASADTARIAGYEDLAEWLDSFCVF